MKTTSPESSDIFAKDLVEADILLETAKAGVLGLGVGAVLSSGWGWWVAGVGKEMYRHITRHAPVYGESHV